MTEQFFRDMKFRPRATPARDIPLGARSVGHYRLDADRKEDAGPKHFTQVFWGIQGKGTVLINNEERVLSAGQVAIYLPGMEHHLRAVSDVWEYRWWTMDGPLAAGIVAGLGFTADIYRSGPAPVERFEELTSAIQDLSARGERNASAIAYSLLCAVRRHGRPLSEDPLIAQCLGIVHRDWSNPSLGVEALATRLNKHRSTLSREFRANVGITLVEYLTRLRVQNALSLLKETHDSVADIAARCGYSDPNYFCRIIRRRTGQSPLQFRKR